MAMTEATKLSGTQITQPQNCEPDAREMDPTAKEELKNLISMLDSSSTSDKLYNILVTIRSQYSNVDGSNISGIHRF